jgi:autotransporter-associated beta strand protein
MFAFRKGPKSKRLQRPPAFRPGLEALETRLAPSATRYWTGADHSHSLDWSDDMNWNKVNGHYQQIAVGDTLVFNYGQTGLASVRSTNDEAVGTNFGAIKFEGQEGSQGAFVINGNGITLGSGGVVCTATGSQSIPMNLPIDLTRNLTVSDSGATVILGGELSGSYSLITTGSGGVALAAANTYSGATTVQQGVLILQNSAALASSSGTTVDGGATLELTGGLSYASEPLTLNGYGIVGGALFNDSGNNTWAGPITLASTSQIVSVHGTTMTLSGAIGGTGDMVVAGHGDLALTGPGSTYAGTTYVNQGTLLLGGSASVVQVPNNLVVGDGQGSPGSVIVSVSTDNPIAIGSAVTVNSDGLLQLQNASQTVGSVSGSGAISLTGGTLSVGEAGGSGTFSGQLEGTGSLAKIGSGTETLSGASGQFTGQAVVNGGTLALDNAHALGSAAATVNANGTLELEGGISFAPVALTLNGSPTAGNATLLSASGSTWEGTISLAGAANNFLASQAGTLDITGVIQGSQPLDVSGPGAVRLSAADTYSGPTAVYNGVLIVANAASLSGDYTIVTSGATLDLVGGITVNPSQLILSGSGFGNLPAFQSVGGADTWQGDVVLNSTSSIGAAYLTSLTLTGPVQGSGGLTKVGDGRVTLSAADTYTGATAVQQGTLALTNSSAVSSSSGTTVDSGATLELVGGLDFGSEPLTLNGGGYNSQGALDVVYSESNPDAPAPTSSRWDGPITLAGDTVVHLGANMVPELVGIISGSGGLTEVSRGQIGVNPGILWLLAANTYAGLTTVSSGVLDVSGSLVGNVHVGANGKLTGAGPVGNVTVNGALNQGAYPVYTGLLQTDALTLNQSSTFEAVIQGTTAGSTYGQVDADGPVTLNGGTLNVTLLAPYQAHVGDTFTIIDTGGVAVSGTFDDALHNPLYTLTVDNVTFSVSYAQGVVLTVTHVG